MGTTIVTTEEMEYRNLAMATRYGLIPFDKFLDMAIALFKEDSNALHGIIKAYKEET